MEEKRRYTQLKDNYWILESTSPALLASIQLTKEFTDNTGKTHKVIETNTKPDGHPEAPYYFVLGVTVED